ncbi:MAG: urease accessory protein UreD [Acetobacteraceae bacterium]|nr:urease accessory protein UreD [Acetobacteraceae bacterium]
MVIAGLAGTGRLARSVGRLALAFRRRGARTVLFERAEAGALRVRLPHHDPRTPPVAVTLNNAGGLAGGDDLAVTVRWEEGAEAAVASAAAERVYRARTEDPPARVRVRLEVAAGASAAWLPQETILFDAARLDRETHIALADDTSRFVGVEAVVFGRLARGEVMRTGLFRDRIVLGRAGRPLLIDPTRLAGDIAAALDRPAVAGGRRAAAAILAAGPDVARLLDPLREALARAPAGVEGGASSWDGVLFARLVAADGLSLRRTLIDALAILRPGQDLPRVWQC